MGQSVVALQDALDDYILQHLLIANNLNHDLVFLIRGPTLSCFPAGDSVAVL